jgi:hypothetical protein
MLETVKFVFIIHHSDEQGRVRVELLAGILNLLNIPIKFGENLRGERLSVGVQKLIEASHLVVALLTLDVKVGEGTWVPSQWVMQEVTWAVAHHVPCLLLVEEGVKFDACIAGDLEQIRFAPDKFESILVRAVSQVQTLISLDTSISGGMPAPNLSDHVKLLIMEGTEYAKKRRWDEVLRVSEEALQLDSRAAQAALRKGVALLHLGQLISAERFFLRMRV